jgi:hypothetical protein
MYSLDKASYIVALGAKLVKAKELSAYCALTCTCSPLFARMHVVLILYFISTS